MAGVSNSWIEQYTTQPSPCIADTSNSSGFSSCIVWLLIGLVIGGIAFEKKSNRRIES